MKGDAHLALAREAAVAGMVLLKNGPASAVAPVLPDEELKRLELVPA